MMDFSESPLKVLADDIADAKTNGGLYKWEVKFKLKDTSPVDLTDEKLVYTDEEKDGFFEPLSLMNLDIVSNYLDRNSDQFNFVLVVSPGMWVHIILPSRDHCMIHLTRTKLAALGGVEDDTQNVQTWVLKPIFNVPEDANLEHDVTAMIPRKELDLKAPFEITFDAIEPAAEQMRALEVDGNWREASPMQVLRAVVVKRCNDIEVDGKPGVTGFVFEEGGNKDIREHVLIPQGTIKLPKLTEHLQEKCGGLYSTGASSYLQDGIWTTFSPFNTEDFAKADESITLVVVPPQVYGDIDSTYKVEDKRITAIVASNFKVNDNQAIAYLNEGDGVRFASATKLSESFAKTKDNKAIAKRSTNNSESRIKDETNEHHYTAMASKRITDNSLAEYSRLAARRGQTLIAEWRKADHTLIKPGMRVKVMYQDHEEVRELFGRVINKQASIQKLGYGMIVTDHLSTCTLHVFFNPPNTEPL